MSELSQKILEKIKKREIEPKARWQFLLRDWFLWGAFGFSVVLGSAAFAVMIFVLNDREWDIYKFLDKSFLEYLILCLPYLWLAALGLFLWLAFYNFEHTKTGYRHNPWLVTGVSFVLSLILGAVFFYGGLGAAIDEIFANNLPLYQKVMQHKQDIWCHPDRGLLWGKIIKIENGQIFLLSGCNRQEWTVKVREPAVCNDLTNCLAGEKIKVIGEAESPNVFLARELRLWTKEPAPPPFWRPFPGPMTPRH